MVEISVIIPCYNQEKYIGECIESVLAQTFKNYEIIVVNDGSTDESATIISNYHERCPQKIKVIQQVNRGVVCARNAGIALAKGKYIFPLDGDDYIPETCLQTLYGAMIDGKGDVICGETELVGARTGKMNVPRPTFYNMILSNCVVCSALYSKSMWIKYGGYDEKMGKGFEDWEFWLNFVSERRKIHRVNEITLFYRCLNDSRNNSIKSGALGELYCYMRRKHRNIYRWEKLVLFLRFVSGLFRKKT